MANGTQCKGGVAGAGWAVVFAKMGVQHVKATFDKPAASQMFQRECRVGLVSRYARDRIGRGLANPALFDRVAFQLD